jgi:fatty aldehyde-generating acyl-ACP reductase
MGEGALRRRYPREAVTVGEFAFLIHPVRGAKDAARKYPLLGLLPECVLEQIVRRMSPKVVSEITGVRSLTGAECHGWFVGCPLTPRQFLELPEEYVVGKIIRAAEVAQEAGAKVVGLGAMTSVVGDQGMTVAKNVDIAVTTGNSYTVWTAVEGAKQAARLLGTDPAQAHVAVMGATGAIGQVCVRMMADEAPEVTLIGRNEARLAEVAASVEGRASVTYTTDAERGLREADIVITVTSAVDTVVPVPALKRGAVVCDVARPRDVSRRVVKERPDVLVIEGGAVEVPGEVDFHFNFGFPPKMGYACMAETMILALEERYESYSLGRELSLERVYEMARLAEKHGFKLAGFRSFERQVTEEYIATVRRAAGR